MIALSDASFVTLSRVPLRDNGRIRLSALLASIAYWPRKQVRRLKPVIDGVPFKASDTFDIPEHGTACMEVLGERFYIERDHSLLLAMHKPAGVVTGRDNAEGTTIYDLLPDGLYDQHLEPIGRLDKDTSGLLLLSEDGQLNQQLRHPSRAILRGYRATLARAIPMQMIEDALAQGVKLKDGHVVRPLKMERLDDQHGDPSWAVTLDEGKYHEVRRLFAAMGSHVLTLHRAQYGPCHLASDATPTVFAFEEEIPVLCDTADVSSSEAVIMCQHGLQRIDGAAKAAVYDHIGLEDLLQFAVIRIMSAM